MEKQSHRLTEQKKQERQSCSSEDEVVLPLERELTVRTKVCRCPSLILILSPRPACPNVRRPMPPSPVPILKKPLAQKPLARPCRNFLQHPLRDIISTKKLLRAAWV